MSSLVGHNHPWWQRALALALSATLTVTGAPAAAWAEAAAETQAIQEGEGQGSTDQQAAGVDGGAAAVSASSGGNASDGNATGVGASSQNGSGSSQAQGDDDAKGVSASQNGEASDGDTSSQGDSAADPDASLAKKAPAANGLSESGVAPTNVQMQHGGTEASSGTGLSIGDVLTAVPGTMEEDRWGYGEEFTALDDASGCTYQWYRGSQSVSYASGSSSFTDCGYEPIAGATSATYTVQENDAGSCLAVKVTYDGKDIWSGSSTGAVKPAGAVTLGSVELTGTPSVGSTLTAKAYGGSSWNKQDLPGGTKVTYTWRYSDSNYGSWTTIDGASGSTLELTDEYRGKYISVTANAGDNTVELSSYSALGPVLGKGETKLDGVRLVGTPDRVEVGTQLTAEAYTGSSYNHQAVTSGVTYTWRYSDSEYGPWNDIEGVQGSTYAVADWLAGKYISVSASAGANTVDLGSYSVVGPVRLKGQVDIYSAYTTVEQNSTSGVNKYRSSDTIWAQATEKSSSATIDPSRLNYQWQASDDGSTWTDIEGAGEQSLLLTNYEGKYVRCHVSAKVGTSFYNTNPRKNKVAPADAIDVRSVQLSTYDSLQVGDKVTATVTDQSSKDVTANNKVKLQWYASDSTYGTGTAIVGATEATLTIREDLLDKYVYAQADGSNGAWSGVSSSKAGPVKIAGAVALDHVEATGRAVIGGEVTAQAYTSSYMKAGPTDTVLYQWQYASSNTTSDVLFQDIPGATSATYTIPESFTDASDKPVSLLGKYLRVKATSDGSVVSTSKKSYYGNTPVDPLGPVTVEGGYDLTGVKLSSDKTNAQVGATLSAVAQYLKKGSYQSYDADVPNDAEVSYTWYQADDATGANRKTIKSETITGSALSTVTLGAEQEGKYVWVEAQAHMNPAASERQRVEATGTYDLHHVNLSPTSGRVLTGSEVSASVYASRLGSSTPTEVTDKDGVGIQWYVADSKDTASDAWTPLQGATSAKLTVPDSAKNKYLRVVVTSGSSSVSATFESPVADAASLEGAKAILEKGYGWRPTLEYGTDTNINNVLKDYLASQGFDVTGLTVRVRDVTFGSANAGAQIGISNDESERNGDITYFYVDPSEVSSWDVTSLHTVRNITFELSREGEQPVEFAPSRTFQIPWDKAKLGELLQEKADQLSISYAAGDTADSVTAELSLPYRLGDGWTPWAGVTWKSSDEGALAISGSGYRDYRGAPARGSANKDVDLTATVLGSSSYDMPSDVAATKTFKVTVKADPDKVTSAKTDLQNKLENNFTVKSITKFDTNEGIDPEAVAYDLQMPRPRALGVDGGIYEVKFSADSNVIAFNGYHGTVVQPLDADKDVQVTCTITDKSNPEITANKTLGLKVSKVSTDEIDDEIALLDQAEAGYKAALLDGQGEPVSSNLSTFQKAYLNESGQLVFARSVAEASGHAGIVPTDLPGYDGMGSYDQARTFKSSNKSVVLNETLQLAWNADRSTSLSQYQPQPTYNTKVTIGSRLRSERFGAYYDQCKDDPTIPQELKDKLARLAGDDVSADISVVGTSGKDDPSGTAPADDPSKQGTVRATVNLIQVNADGTQESWLADADSGELPAGSTVADATKAALDKNGISYDAGLLTFTRGGQSLGWNAKTGQYWNLYVNGQFAQKLPGNLELSSGDVITWIYQGYEQQISVNDVKIDPAKVRPTKIAAEWPSYRSGNNETSAPVPTTQTGSAWVQQVYRRTGADDMNGVSEPILVGGRVFVAVGDTLQMRSASDGKVLRSAKLAASIDSTCRMTYANGIVVVPLHSGMLQAITPDDLTTVWVAPSVEGTARKSSQQALSTLMVSDGYVYAGTSDAGKTSGYLRCVRLSDGKVMWTHRATGSSGYYWSGAAVTSHGVLVAQNDGQLDLMATQGSNGQAKVLRSLRLPSQVSSTVVAASNDTAYVMGYNGTLYKVAVGDGSLSVAGSRKLCDYSISTPTVVGGKVYVGGSAPGSLQGGGLYVLDANTLNVEHVVTGFSSGSALAGAVAASPLVVSRNGSTYVYFTANDGIGGIYLYRVGDAAASYLYVPTPDAQQYTISSLAVDAEGRLYYVNDSGRLFKVGGGIAGGLAPNGGSGGSSSSVGNGNGNGTQDSKNDREEDPRTNPNGGDDGDMGGGTSNGGGNQNGGGSNNGRGSNKGVSNNGGSGTVTRGGLRRSSGDYFRGTRSWHRSGAALRPLWVLSDEGSDELDSSDEALPATKAQDGAQAEDAQATAQQALPVWPLVGMGLGALALVLVLVWYWHRGEE